MTARTMTISTTENVSQHSESTDEYSISRCSASDLDAVTAIAKAVSGTNAYPKFLLAQLVDILGPGFLVARTGGADDARIVGFTVTTPHAQERRRGVVLALTVDPAHPGARQALLDAATSYLRDRNCEELTFAVTSAPEAATDALGERSDEPALPGPYTVRRFTPADLDDVYRVELSAFGDDPYPRAFFLQLADALGNGFLVAERGSGADRQVVGYLLGVLDSAAADRGWVMSVAVHHFHRGRHVGWQLMEGAEDYFDDRHRTEVLLTVDPDNSVAVELYKHRHYDEIGRKDGLYGMGLSRLVMRRLLRMDALPVR